MMRGNLFGAVAVLITSTACSGKHRPFADGVAGSGGTESSTNSESGLPGAEQAPLGLDNVGDEASGVAQQDPEGLPPVGGVQPAGAVSGETNASCEGDAGQCASTGDEGISACVPTGPRDCTSDLDNDCDGQPDNVLDDFCVCVPESIEPCDEHPGLDGRGQCRAGSRTCILGEGGLTTNWGACEGSVGPGEQDSCSVVGDDTNCDGTNNGDCPCIEGEARPCGPETENGICQRGSQTCENGRFGQCGGAAFAAPRNCSSNQDNDCDGRPDNAVDNVCTCTIGAVQACGTHPGRDGNGQCRAGSQTCEGRANNATSTFGACTGSVGPLLQDSCANGNDGNCNGVPNEGCACVNGQTRACGPDTEVGACQRGTQTCANGSFGQCQGAVFPAPRNCASPQDNDCDGRPDNTLDNVCGCQGCQIGQTCFPPGTINPNNSCQICNPTQNASAFVGNTGASCGSAPSTCSAQDTCSAAGVCQPNHVASGATCNGGLCDGAGACRPPFTCNNTSPPATVGPASFTSFFLGQPPAAAGGLVRNGRYVPTRVDLYSDGTDVPINEYTFEFRDGFVQVGYQGFNTAGIIPVSPELQFVGTATSVGSSLRFDVDSCDAGCTESFSDITCSVPASLSYSATANSLVTIQAGSTGTAVITYSRQ